MPIIGNFPENVASSRTVDAVIEGGLSGWMFYGGGSKPRPYRCTQDISVEGLKADSNGTVALRNDATSEQIKSARYADMYILRQSEGGLTIAARNSYPSVDIPITITIME